MSGERDINYLLSQYEKPYVPGEQLTNTTKQKIRHESKRKNRHLILDELLNESKIHLNKNSKDIVRYLIDNFNEDFKELHRKVSEETIILAFIFYAKKIETPSIRLERYKIFKKYGLTDHVFELILSRMLLRQMEQSRIKPTVYMKDEHEILIREGKRR